MASRHVLASISLLALGGLTLGLAAPAMAAIPDAQQYHSATTAGSVALLGGYSSGKGNELFSTDGTPAGTKLVKDLVPGKVSGLDLSDGVPEFTTIGTKTFFAAHGVTTNVHLWVTDGAAAGTTQLTGAGTFKYGSYPRFLTALGDELYFVVQSPSVKVGWVLWKSDGTKSGTKAVSGLVGKKGKYGYVGSMPQHLTVVGSKLYFSAVSSKDTSQEDIWSTDGTTTKRELSYTQTNIGTGRLLSLSEFDGKLVITTDSKLKKEQRLWSYDGTGVPVALSKVTSVATLPVAFGGSLFFVSKHFDGMAAPRLLRVTPTEVAGGVSATVLNSDDVENLVVEDGKLWFETHSGTESIWTISDGSAAPVLVKKTTVAPITLDNFDSRATAYLDGSLYFMLRSQLWKSDGTSAGTVPVLSFNMPNGRAYLTSLAVAGNGIAVTLQDSKGKSALWLSDGTAEGTTKVLPAS